MNFMVTSIIEHPAEVSEPRTSASRELAHDGCLLFDLDISRLKRPGPLKSLDTPSNTFPMRLSATCPQGRRIVRIWRHCRY